MTTKPESVPATKEHVIIATIVIISALLLALTLTGISDSSDLKRQLQAIQPCKQEQPK